MLLLVLASLVSESSAMGVSRDECLRLLRDSSEVGRVLVVAVVEFSALVYFEDSVDSELLGRPAKRKWKAIVQKQNMIGVSGVMGRVALPTDCTEYLYQHVNCLPPTT